MRCFSMFSFPLSFRRCGGALAMIALLGVAAEFARADTLAIRRAGEADSIAPTVYTDVKIVDIKLGHIVFTTASGNKVIKELSSVVSMTIDDEPEFNQAQQDYAANHLDKAVDEFEVTIQKTDKPWLKAYCEPLFTDAANKSGRFDRAVEGYVYLVLNQPKLATPFRPTVPPPDSGFLDSAAKSLSDAASTADLTSAQQAALLSLLLDVDKARKDTAGIDDVASRLGKVAGDPGSSTANIASVALADAKITEAANAVYQNDYNKAASIIKSNGGMFLTPVQQENALYILARAREGQAEAKNDPAAWQDAVIAYMRVVANFKDAAGATHVANSLIRAAHILDAHLNESGKALHIYQSVQTQYSKTPSADEAAKEITRLQAAGVQAD
jgi:hypothetical protein